MVRWFFWHFTDHKAAGPIKNKAHTQRKKWLGVWGKMLVLCLSCNRLSSLKQSSSKCWNDGHESVGAFSQVERQQKGGALIKSLFILSVSPSSDIFWNSKITVLNTKKITCRNTVRCSRFKSANHIIPCCRSRSTAVLICRDWSTIKSKKKIEACPCWGLYHKGKLNSKFKSATEPTPDTDIFC